MGLSLLSLVIRASLAQGLMKVSWTVMHYWLSKTNNEKKMDKALIHNEMEFNFFSCNNKKYFWQKSSNYVIDSESLIHYYTYSAYQA